MERLCIWMGVAIGMLGALSLLVYPGLKSMAVGMGKAGWETSFLVVSCSMVVLGLTLTFWVSKLFGRKPRKRHQRKRPTSLSIPRSA